MDLYFEDTVYEKLLNTLKVDDRVVVTSRLFMDFKSDSERVALAYQLLQDEGLLPKCHFFYGKSERSSQDLRCDGNTAYREGKDWEAMGYYNLSLGAAPVNSREFALAAGNRSAVQFALGYPEACLQDIALAIRHGYPAELQYKLLERKAKCHIILGNRDEATVAVKEIEDKLLRAASSLPDEKLKAHQGALHVLEEDLDKLISDQERPAERSHFGHEENPNLSYEQNAEMDCASDAIALHHSKELGRHIIATRDISPGDVLAVEKPYMSVLLPKYMWTHCYYCLKRCSSAMPCLQCCKIMYCSELCRSQSWERNHRIDCSLLPAMVERMGRMSLLAIRVLLVASKQGSYLRELQDVVETIEAEAGLDPRKLGFNSQGQYVSADYRPIHYLVGNRELRAVADLFRRAVTAAVLVHYLERLTTYFSENTEDDLRWFAGGILLRHLMSLPCNAHEVSEMMVRNGRYESIEVGGAAYAFLSLINHSCDPNVVRHSYGDNAVLRAIRPIRAGEQVLDNYGYHYSVQERAVRQERLKQQYFFSCACPACIGDWPLYAVQPKSQPRFKCTICREQLSSGHLCQFCGETTNVKLRQGQLDESSSSFRHHLLYVVAGQPRADTLDVMLEHLYLMDCVLDRPWREYSECQEAIKQCLSLQANHCVDIPVKKGLY